MPTKLDTQTVPREHAAILMRYGHPLVRMEIKTVPTRRVFYAILGEEDTESGRVPGVHILTQHICGARRS